MSFLKKLPKSLKSCLKPDFLIGIAGIIGLIILVNQIVKRKTTTDESHTPLTPEVYNAPAASSPDDETGNFGNVNETSINSEVNGSNPEDLLPVDQNNEWSKLNPVGTGDLNNVNLLKAGYHTGIDTVGSSLRNANLQIRSEFPNPTTNVSPWMNTTIEPDTMRVPLELGSSNQ
tara:strand:- start:3274 stop:3795 length:522 start_codon:yes stop_codon:yes gene_type:complete